MTDNEKDKKLLKDPKGDAIPLDKGDLKRGESIFESTWMRIHDEFDKMKNEDDVDIEDEKLNAKDFISKKKKDKSKKGKDQKLEDKISSSDIKDWFEHKLHPTSFMEYLKTIFKDKNGPDIKYSFGEFVERDQNIPFDINLNKFEDGDLAFVKMDEELKKRIDSYGNLMIDQYLKRVNYLFI